MVAGVFPMPNSESAFCAAPDHRKMDKEYVIEPALGPKSLEATPPRSSVVPAMPVQPAHSRPFASPARPHMDASDITSGQQPRPLPHQGKHVPTPPDEQLASRPATAAACLEPSAPVVTPPADDYPVAEDPVFDESPESMTLNVADNAYCCYG